MTVSVCRLAFLWRAERIGPQDLTLAEYDLVSAFLEGLETFEEQEKRRKEGKALTREQESVMYGGEVEMDYDDF